MKRSILILTMLFVALSQSFLPKSARAQAPSALQYEVLYISGKIIYPRLITRKGLGSFMPLQASSASNNKVIVAVVTVTRWGFEPAKMTAIGRFLLSVENRSWEPELRFTLDRETGNHVTEIHVHEENPDHREVLDLTPGKYLLREANHPEWLCQIEVQPPR